MSGSRPIPAGPDCRDMEAQEPTDCKEFQYCNQTFQCNSRAEEDHDQGTLHYGIAGRRWIEVQRFNQCSKVAELECSSSFGFTTTSRISISGSIVSLKMVVIFVTAIFKVIYSCRDKLQLRWAATMAVILCKCTVLPLSRTGSHRNNVVNFFDKCFLLLYHWQHPSIFITVSSTHSELRQLEPSRNSFLS